jgi:hypothetical protein
VIAQGRLASTSDPFVNAGLEVLDSHAVRLSVSPFSPVGAATSPLGLGAGTRLRLSVIPSGNFMEFDVEIELPANVSASDVTVTLNAERVVSEFIGPHPNGLVALLGDSTAFYVAESDGVVGPAAPADDTVLLPDATIVAQGVPIYDAAEALAFDDLDGSAVALGPGESYAALISYGADGRAVTKGDLSAGTPAVPATPADHLARTTVVVPFGLVIVDVTGLIPAEGNLKGEAAGFDLTISPGFANTGQNRVTPQTLTVLSLSGFPNAETDAYLDTGATFQLTPRGVPLTGSPTPLWRAVTDGAGITSLEDLRAFAAGEGYF